MRRLLTALAVLGACGLCAGRAGAWQYGHTGPYAQTAAFPLANPPGWYTNTYSFAWYYPWFAYYNYSHGPYANWMSGGGFATYSTYTGHPVMYRPYLNAGGYPGAGFGTGTSAPATAASCTLTVTLPADAKLLFNGTPATVDGTVRTFTTPPLQPGTDYAYDLVAEVVRGGKVVSESKRVVLRAGGKTAVALSPGGAAAVSSR